MVTIFNHRLNMDQLRITLGHLIGHIRVVKVTFGSL